MTGLSKITDKILGDARADAARIAAEADARCAQIALDYRRKALSHHRRLDEEAKRSAEELVARAKADAVTLRKRAAEDIRAQMVEEVFDTAYRQVLNLPAEEYLHLLTLLLGKALREEWTAFPEESYTVLLNEQDRERYGKVLMEAAKAAAEAGQLPLCPDLSEETVPIDGGLILRRGDIELNASIRVLFAALRNHEQAKVVTRLFAERRG